MRDIRPAPGPQNTPQKPKGIPQLPSSGPQLPAGSTLPPGLKKTPPLVTPPPPKKTPPAIPSLNKKAPLPGTPVFNKNVPPPKRLTGSTVPVSNIHVAPPEKILRSTPLKPAVSKPLPVAPLPPKSAPVKPVAVAPTKVRVGHRERKFVVGLIVLAILAALLAGFIFIPQATVALSLRTAPLLVDERLTIQAEVGAAEAVPGSAFFREVQVEGTAPVTSTEVIGTKATGTVQIINRATEVQKIKEQSRLVTKDGELFYMQGSATVPAASAGSPSGVTVTIEAAEAGEQGNIAPQRLNFAALDPSSQTLVYAEVTQPLKGGSGETQSIVKDADLEAARKAAGEAARAQVEQQIRGELDDGWTILEESWTSEITNFETPVKVDAKESTIPYTARAVVRVMGYQQSALEAKLKTALEARMDKDFMLFPGPISYSKSVEEVKWEEAKATVSVRVTHTTIPQISLETLRQKLAGRTQAEAKEYLENLPGVRSVSIKLWPFWVTSIPRIEKRIKLDLQSERQP